MELTTLPPYHVPTLLKSGSLILLEPSGLVQNFNGIALPSYHHNLLSQIFHTNVILYIYIYIYIKLNSINLR